MDKIHGRKGDITPIPITVVSLIILLLIFVTIYFLSHSGIVTMSSLAYDLNNFMSSI